MRKIMLPLVLVTAFLGLGSAVMVGCGGSSTSTEHDDLAVKKPDLLQVVDSAVAMPGCAATIACEDACTGSDTAIAACQKACDAAESKEGSTLENNYYNCIYTACGAQPDNTDLGTGVCAYNPTTFTFDNQSACDACLNASVQGSCMTEYTACMSDTSGM